MPPSPPRVRFAPSPTGSLHLGNARTALFNWLVARQRGGTLVLRIEDTDVDRHEEGSEQKILDDLRWLGLDWDEGPDVGGPRGPYRQSERGERYRRSADTLRESGRAYRCFCEERGPRTPGRRTLGCGGGCERLDPAAARERAAAGEAHAVRFRVLPPDPDPADLRIRFHDRLRGPIEVDATEVADPVLLRRDGRPTYNFAVVVDDGEMGIDLVLRGDDHLSNTPRQVLLFRSLGLELPEFVHLPMVRGADGSRLSKRHGAVSLAEYRERGYPREALVNALALLGWAPPGGERSVFGIEELLQEFDLDRVNRAPAAFDAGKLDWLSSRHLQQADAGELGAAIGRRLAAAGLLPDGGVDAGWLAGVAEMLRTKIDRLDQAAERAAPLFAPGGDPGGDEARAALRGEEAGAVVAALVQFASDAEPETAEAWKELKQVIQRESGAKGKALFHPLRVALTGAVSGPELDRLVPLIVRGHRLLPDHVPSLGGRVRRTAGWLR
jgi:glutamyl-tRNA synthetase/nondiscriminating glutamyl-tRNA synthetase